MVAKAEARTKGKAKKTLLPFAILAATIVIFLTTFVEAQNYYFSPFSEEYAQFFPEHGTSQYCNLTQNFLVYVDPIEGCQPQVVRSDLLEEQPVHVFCKLKTINLNPLLKSIYIKNVNIHAVNKSHDIVQGVIFHVPYLYENIMSKYFSSPGKREGLAQWDNLGYAVVQLRQEPVEAKIPERVDINATATIYYTSSMLYGIDRDQFDLQKLSDAEFEQRYDEFAFFNGRGFLRLIDASENSAEILVYKETIHDPTPMRLSLVKGQPTPVAFWGFFCDNQNFEIELNSIDLPKTKAKLVINGKSYTASQGQIVDECVVSSIEERGFGVGTVRLTCAGQEAVLELQTLTKVKLQKEEGGQKETKELGLGQYFRADNNFIYFIFANSSYAAFLNVSNALRVDVLESVMRSINKNVGLTDNAIAAIQQRTSGKVIVVGKGQGIAGYSLTEISVLEDKRLSPEVERAWEDAKIKYKGLFDKYRNEKDVDNEYIGAKALFELFQIAKEIGRQQEALGILNQLIDAYANSDSRIVRRAYDERRLLNYDSSLATATLDTPKGLFTIELKGIYMPSSESIYARIRVDGVEKNFGLREHIGHGWIVDEISDNNVILKNEAGTIVSLVKGKEDSLPYKEIESGKEGTKEKVSAMAVKLIDTKVEKVANVIVSPPKQEMQAESNFSIHIGIEKRAIQIGPEKTKEYIKKLNKTIATLQGIQNKLAKVVQGWKKACYIGGTALFLKSFIEGMGGKATARKLVMNGIDGRSGWDAICQDKVNNKEYKTVSQCLKANSAKIEKEVELTTGFLKNINQQIANANKQCANNATCFYGQIQSQLTCPQGQAQEQVKNCQQFISNLTEMAERGIIMTTSAKDLLLATSIMNCKECSNEIKTKAQEIFEAKINNYLTQLDLVKNIDPQNEIYTKFGRVDLETIIPYKTVIQKDQSGKEYFIIPDLNGWGPHYVEVKHEMGAITIVDVKKYVREGGGWTKKDPEECNKYVQGTTCIALLQSRLRVEESKCNVPLKTPYDKEAHFYEAGQWKGRVKYLPLSRILKGLYVYVPDEYQVKSYLESGILNVYWLCNAGENGIPDMALYGSPNDDLCTMVTSEGLQAIASSPICYDEPTKTIGSIAQQIQQCVADANVQKRSGKAAIQTACSGELKAREVAKVSSLHCEDFMSARDCWLLFNLCDPVLCPPSRCDLGGRYPVDNVVQSGIIGSLVLCSHNFEGGKGVLVPVCLTGINAGLENVISILNATRDCLQESLESGKTVGICDMIKSIYLCELMWRELTPFIKVGIPSIIEKFERKGGGEYAFFSENWRRTWEGMDYFINYYGTTAIEAFKLRSTAEVGSMICKKFIGIRYPSAASLLEELSKPESPYQFFATVTEIPYTEATVPPQSQYKVFYHIYAGKDQGVYYSVYLKSPTQYPGVMTIENWVIDTGYIPRGDHRQVTKDFTAPKGYKQVCVSINAREYCGFQVVSTSFAANWLQDRYIEDQLKDVKTSKQCVSGSPSLVPTAAIINLQAGIEQALSPAIYRQGIVRMCSSKNPGVGAEEADWAPAGYCDSSEIKCWVYLPSLRQAIKDVGLENASIKTLEEKARLEKIKQILGQDLGFMKEDEIADLSGTLEEKINNNKNIIDEAKNNVAKANLPAISQLQNAFTETQKLVLNASRQLIRIINPEAMMQIEQKITSLYGQAVLLKYYEKEGPKLVEEKKKREEEKKKEEKKPPAPPTPPPAPAPAPTPIEKEEIPEIVAFLVVGNGSDPNAIYTTFNTTTRNIIEWDDKDTEICLVVGVRSGEGYKYYSQKKIYIEAGTQSGQTEEFGTNIQVDGTIYKISPWIKGKKDYYRTTKSKEDNYEHWIKYNNADYEYIEYEYAPVDGGYGGECWLLSEIQKDKGTFFYAFSGTIENGGRGNYRFDLPVLNIKNLEDTAELENQLKKYYLVIPYQTCEKGKQCAGLITLNPEKVLKISRKSNFGEQHEGWCKNNEMGCKIIETAESYYGVPYVGDAYILEEITIGGEKFNVSDLGLAADCGTFVDSVLKYNGLPLTACSVLPTKNNLSVVLGGTIESPGVYVGDMLNVPKGAAFIYSDSDRDPKTLIEDDELISITGSAGTVDVKTIKVLRNPNYKFWTNNDPEIEIFTYHRRGDGNKCLPQVFRPKQAQH